MQVLFEYSIDFLDLSDENVQQGTDEVGRNCCTFCFDRIRRLVRSTCKQRNNLLFSRLSEKINAVCN